MKKLSIYIVFLIIIKSTLAQEVSVKVVFNNTNDLKTKSDFIAKINNELVNKVKLEEAINVLNSFYTNISGLTLTDKNMLIYVAFLDKEYFAGFKLKEEEKLTFNNYITSWQDKYGSQSAALFMFEKSGNNYSFKKLAVSTQLQDEHLFPKVVEFINTNLSGDVEDIIKNGTLYLANALKPVWNQDFMNYAIGLTSVDNYPEYHKGYSNDIYEFYDFSSYHFLWPADDAVEVERDYDYIHKLDSYLSRNGKVDNQITKISNYGYHHNTKNVSEWVWLEDGELETDASKLTDFYEKVSEHSYNESSNTRSFEEGENYCRIQMEQRFTSKGDYLAIFEYKQIFGYQPTWCNQFANELSKNKLIGHIPWGSSGYRASQIHDVIRFNNPKFKELTFDEAWEYTNAGYVVYLTSYHSSGVNYKSDGSVNYWSSSPGHIATCYPTTGEFEFLDGFLVQAGGFNKTKKIEFKNAWGSSYGENREMVKAHVYLNNIIQ